MIQVGVLLVCILVLVTSSFEEFMVSFGREYTGEERLRREEVYNQNIKLITQFNLQNNSYTLTPTAWTDRFPHQIQQGINTKFRSNSKMPDHSRGGKYKVGDSQARNVTYIDWREKGAVSPIREQGGCGACWAFATTASVESDFLMKTGITLDLSEEFIIECAGPENTCAGGFFEDAYVIIFQKGGMPLEARYPYRAGGHTQGLPEIDPNICSTTQIVEFTRDKDNKTNVDMHYYDNITNQQLEKVLLDSPVSGHVAVNQFFIHVQGGVINCNMTITDPMINHGVQIVGFNSTGRYYIIKNSWGTRWGINGFGHLSYDEDCGLKKRVYTFRQDPPVARPVEVYSLKAEKRDDSQVEPSNVSGGVRQFYTAGLLMCLLLVL